MNRRQDTNVGKIQFEGNMVKNNLNSLSNTPSEINKRRDISDSPNKYTTKYEKCKNSINRCNIY